MRLLRRFFEVDLFVLTDKSSRVGLKFTSDEQTIAPRSLYSLRGMQLANDGLMEIKVTKPVSVRTLAFNTRLPVNASCVNRPSRIHIRRTNRGATCPSRQFVRRSVRPVIESKHIITLHKLSLHCICISYFLLSFIFYK